MVLVRRPYNQDPGNEVSEVAGAGDSCPGGFEGEERFALKGERGWLVCPDNQLDVDSQSLRYSIRRAVCRVVCELD